MGRLFRRIIVIVVVLAIIAGAGYYLYSSKKVYYNDGSVVGNTTGNLYGKGTFCQYDSRVYFANPNDNNSLYVMDLNEDNVEKISSDRINFINIDDNYIYYCRDNNNDDSEMSFLNVDISSLVRMKHDGSDLTILDSEICTYLSQYGNSLYYYHFEDNLNSIYTVGIDGENDQKFDDNAIDPRCVYNGKMYYSGVVNDHYIYSKDLGSGATSTVFEEPAYMPTMTEQYLYYMNLDDDNRVYRVDLSSNETEAVTAYGTSDYNLTGNYIYYQSIKGDPDGIYRVDLNSLEEQLVTTGEYNSINATSSFVYFTDYFTGTVFHSPVKGSGASVFSPAVEIDKYKK